MVVVVLLLSNRCGTISAVEHEELYCHIYRCQQVYMLSSPGGFAHFMDLMAAKISSDVSRFAMLSWTAWVLFYTTTL